MNVNLFYNDKLSCTLNDNTLIDFIINERSKLESTDKKFYQYNLLLENLILALEAASIYNNPVQLRFNYNDPYHILLKQILENSAFQ